MFLGSILNLLFPPRCASCKMEGDFLCKICRNALRIKNIRLISLNPSREDFEHLDGVIYGLDYATNPEIQLAIKQFKYKYTKDLVDYFGSILSEKLGQLSMLNDKKVLFVPVPLHRKREWKRGFNQAQLIADSTAKKMGKRAIVSSLLLRPKNTLQQAKLSKRDRHENLKHAFTLNGNIDSLKEKVCFLVDDVCTTGVTLDNCAKLLKEEGVTRVYGLVVARAFK